MAGDEKAPRQVIMAAHTGMTRDEFSAIVNNRIATVRQPQTGRLLTDMTYEQMKELLVYLRANGFKNFIVTGGGVRFMRRWAERVYGVPPEQGIGSRIKTRCEMQGKGVVGKPVLVYLPDLNFINGKSRKPDGIQ